MIVYNFLSTVRVRFTLLVVGSALTAGCVSGSTLESPMKPEPSVAAEEQPFVQFEVVTYLTLPESTAGSHLQRGPREDELFFSSVFGSRDQLDLLVIDASVGSVIEEKSFTLEKPGWPVFSEDGSFFAAEAGDKVVVVDYESESVFCEFPVDAYGLDFDSDENRLFMFGGRTGMVSVGDLESCDVSDSWPAGPRVSGGLATDSILVVGNSDDERDTTDSITILDQENGAALAQLPFGDWPRGFASSRSQDTLFVSNLWSNEVVALNLASFEELGRVDVSQGYPRNLDVSPDGSLLLVSARKAAIIMDSTTLQTLQTIPVGNGNVVTAVFSHDGQRIIVGEIGKVSFFQQQDG